MADITRGTHYRWVRNNTHHEYALWHVSSEHPWGKYVGTIYKETWKSEQSWRVVNLKDRPRPTPDLFENSLDARDHVEALHNVPPELVVNERREWY